MQTVKKQDVILAGESAPPPASFSFEQMNRMAVSIAKSKLFGVQDADQALSLMMIAQAEGKHPALIARDYDIIQGRPAKKSEAILRDFQATGGRVEWHELTDAKADATFAHPLSPKAIRIVWDLERAKNAGLAGKDMYKKFPRQMLRARCVSEGCRTTAPNSTSGFYTPEEVRDMGHPVEAVSLTAAITQAAELPPDEQVEAFMKAMTAATTLPKLEEAFAAAWRSTKDPSLRDRFKSTYDGVKEDILAAFDREREEVP